MLQTTPTRTVHTTDALAWLEASPVLTDCSLVASMPDISEFSLSLDDWKAWFVKTAGLILSRCPDDGVTIFYQSDIKHEGGWVDKAYLCQKAAEMAGHTLLWHRIACRIPPGTRTTGRPSYSHILCFSKDLRLEGEAAGGIEVIPGIGEQTWVRGMGLEACRQLIRFIKAHTGSHTVVNPFCGEGSVLAMANAEGLNAIGLERSEARAKRALRQQLSLNGQNWYLSPDTDSLDTSSAPQ